MGQYEMINGRGEVFKPCVHNPKMGAHQEMCEQITGSPRREKCGDCPCKWRKDKESPESMTNTSSNVRKSAKIKRLSAQRREAEKQKGDGKKKKATQPLETVHSRTSRPLVDEPRSEAVVAEPKVKSAPKPKAPPVGKPKRGLHAISFRTRYTTIERVADELLRQLQELEQSDEISSLPVNQKKSARGSIETSIKKLQESQAFFPQED